jgi:phosphoglucomutase
MTICSASVLNFLGIIVPFVAKLIKNSACFVGLNIHAINCPVVTGVLSLVSPNGIRVHWHRCRLIHTVFVLNNLLVCDWDQTFTFIMHHMHVICSTFVTFHYVLQVCVHLIETA